MATPNSFWHLLTTYPVAVPLLQRDYAQGRPGAAIQALRRDFVAALRRALVSPFQPLSLDFVYGTVAADGLFTPLDGQQRLTTLFLLHWYLATGAGQVPEAVQAKLGRFSYEVRAAARDFCAALANCPQRPAGSGPLSQALAEEAWFRAGWQRDPTVAGMLVMLNELDEQLRDLPDPAAAWEALRGPAGQSPLTFQLLDLGAHQLSDDLYTRMNARGKPLTAFENWKAWFHEFLEQRHDQSTAAAFAEKLDGTWTDFFWRNRPPGDDPDPAQAVDEPLRAYLDFVTRLLWLRSQPGDTKTTDYAAATVADRYREVYAERDNLHFLVRSLDALAAVDDDMPTFFGRLLSAANTADGRVRAFAGWGARPKAADCNLFRACCQLATEPEPMAAMLFFTVLTYAVRHGGLPETDLPDLRDLLRVMRNRLLGERWLDLFTVRSTARPDKLPRYLQTLNLLLPATEAPQNPYLRLATLPDAAYGLHDERRKACLLLTQPEAERPTWKQALHQLEDNDALRGILHNVDLTAEAAVLRQTAATVTEIWTDEAANDPAALLIRAALTVADYSVQVYDGRWFFGGHDSGGNNGWMAVLTKGSAADPQHQLKSWLPRLLATYQQATGSRQERLQALIAAADANPSPAWPTWQRHFIRYPEMVLCPAWKGGRRGYFNRRSGWNMQQLPKTRVSGYHHNPYVRATALALNDWMLCQEGNCMSWGWDGNGALRYEKLAGTEGLCLRMTEQGWLLELPESLLPLAGVWAELPARLGEQFAVTPAPGDALRQWYVSQPGQWDLVTTGVNVSLELARVLAAPA